MLSAEVAPANHHALAELAEAAKKEHDLVPSKRQEEEDPARRHERGPGARAAAPLWSITAGRGHTLWCSQDLTPEAPRCPRMGE
jgi:hypothetical protein